MAKQLVMYSRTTGCPFISVAKRVLDDYALSYHEIFIDKDMEARRRVQEWTGFLSVPTLIVAEVGEVLPYAMPAPLASGTSPRGINRGTMITEGNIEQLQLWLTQNGFINTNDGTNG